MDCPSCAQKVDRSLQRVDGVVGDVGTSLGVTGNAMRLSQIKPEQFFDG